MGSRAHGPVNPWPFRMSGTTRRRRQSASVHSTRQESLPARARRSARLAANSLQVSICDRSPGHRSGPMPPRAEGVTRFVSMTQYPPDPRRPDELEAQRSALVAEQQLAGDVQAIEAYNAPIRQINRPGASRSSPSRRHRHGRRPSAWPKWIIDLFGYLAPRSIDRRAPRSSSRSLWPISPRPMPF